MAAWDRILLNQVEKALDVGDNDVYKYTDTYTYTPSTARPSPIAVNGPAGLPCRRRPRATRDSGARPFHPASWPLRPPFSLDASPGGNLFWLNEGYIKRNYGRVSLEYSLQGVTSEGGRSATGTVVVSAWGAGVSYVDTGVHVHSGAGERRLPRVLSFLTQPMISQSSPISRLAGYGCIRHAVSPHAALDGIPKSQAELRHGQRPGRGSSTEALPGELRLGRCGL